MKYVLITGANGGMGKATTKLFVEKGFTVFALDRERVESSDGVIPIIADITTLESIKTAFEQVKSITDNLYAIIHFAGVYMLDSLFEIEEEKFEKIFKINLYGAFFVNKAFLPLLKKGGRIMITTSELAPLDPLPFTGIYAVTKSALDKYAYSLKMEAQLLGVEVSVLRAGAVSTGMINASTVALDKFVENTKLYNCNAKKFRKIVNSVEAKSIKPDKIAQKTFKIISAKRPKFVYNVNRNKLLLMLNVLPKRLQLWVIKKILKK
jgi:NAD(P)-dependent dehydrogenase (short-subunit alcohol dehydrogenase family)